MFSMLHACRKGNGSDLGTRLGAGSSDVLPAMVNQRHRLVFEVPTDRCIGWPAG